MRDADEMEAERTLMQSLAVAREQSAKSWELRTAMTVAKLRASQGRVDEGRQLVSAVLGNFGDGLETVDLAAAKNLLAQLASSNPGELSHLS
jgi:predicted ATPase